MPETIQINLTVKFPGGLTVTESQTATIQAYDKVEVVIAKKTQKIVQVQPASKNQIKFLLIKADHYGGLSYQVREKPLEKTSEGTPKETSEGTPKETSETPKEKEAHSDRWIALDALQLFSIPAY